MFFFFFFCTSITENLETKKVFNQNKLDLLEIYIQRYTIRLKVSKADYYFTSCVFFSRENQEKPKISENV